MNKLCIWCEERISRDLVTIGDAALHQLCYKEYINTLDGVDELFDSLDQPEDECAFSNLD